MIIRKEVIGSDMSQINKPIINKEPCAIGAAKNHNLNFKRGTRGKCRSLSGHMCVCRAQCEKSVGLRFEIIIKSLLEIIYTQSKNVFLFVCFVEQATTCGQESCVKYFKSSFT